MRASGAAGAIRPCGRACPQASCGCSCSRSFRGTGRCAGAVRRGSDPGRRVGMTRRGPGAHLRGSVPCRRESGSRRVAQGADSFSVIRTGRLSLVKRALLLEFLEAGICSGGCGGGAQQQGEGAEALAEISCGQACLLVGHHTYPLSWCARVDSRSNWVILIVS